MNEIKAYTKQLFDKDYELANKVITCESGYRANARNSQSTAEGLFQFLDGTWVRYRKMMGKDTDLKLKTNWIENLETAHYAVKMNGWGDWTASKDCWSN